VTLVSLPFIATESQEVETESPAAAAVYQLPTAFPFAFPATSKRPVQIIGKYTDRKQIFIALQRCHEYSCQKCHYM